MSDLPEDLAVLPMPAPGDRVLVDTSAYGTPGLSWCPVTRIRREAEALFPIVVLVPYGARKYGEFQQGELFGVVVGRPVPPYQPCVYALEVAVAAAGLWGVGLLAVMGAGGPWQLPMVVWALTLLIGVLHARAALRPRRRWLP